MSSSPPNALSWPMHKRALSGGGQEGSATSATQAIAHLIVHGAIREGVGARDTAQLYNRRRKRPVHQEAARERDSQQDAGIDAKNKDSRKRAHQLVKILAVHLTTRTNPQEADSLVMKADHRRQ